MAGSCYFVHAASRSLQRRTSPLLPPPPSLPPPFPPHRGARAPVASPPPCSARPRRALPGESSSLIASHPCSAQGGRRLPPQRRGQHPQFACSVPLCLLFWGPRASLDPLRSTIPTGAAAGEWALSTHRRRWDGGEGAQVTRSPTRPPVSRGDSGRALRALLLCGATNNKKTRGGAGEEVGGGGRERGGRVRGASAGRRHVWVGPSRARPPRRGSLTPPPAGSRHGRGLSPPPPPSPRLAPLPAPAPATAAQTEAGGSRRRPGRSAVDVGGSAGHGRVGGRRSRWQQPAAPSTGSGRPTRIRGGASARGGTRHSLDSRRGEV